MGTFLKGCKITTMALHIFLDVFFKHTSKISLTLWPTQGRQFCHRDLQNSETESVRRQLKWIHYQCKIKCESYMLFHIYVCWNVILWCHLAIISTTFSNMSTTCCGMVMCSLKALTVDNLFIKTIYSIINNRFQYI